MDTHKYKITPILSIDDIVAVINSIDSNEITVILPENLIAGRKWTEVRNKAILISRYITHPSTALIHEAVYNDEDSFFLSYFKDNYCKKRQILETFLKKMNIENNGAFSRKFITDTEMLRTIDITLSSCSAYATEIARAVSFRNVIIVQDPDPDAQQGTEIAEIFEDCYRPRSIRILSLPSKVFSYDIKKFSVTKMIAQMRHIADKYLTNANEPMDIIKYHALRDELNNIDPQMKALRKGLDKFSDEQLYRLDETCRAYFNEEFKIMRRVVTPEFKTVEEVCQYYGPCISWDDFRKEWIK